MSTYCPSDWTDDKVAAFLTSANAQDNYRPRLSEPLRPEDFGQYASRLTAADIAAICRRPTRARKITQVWAATAAAVLIGICLWNIAGPLILA